MELVRALLHRPRVLLMDVAAEGPDFQTEVLRALQKPGL